MRMPLTSARPSEIAGQFPADIASFMDALMRVKFDSPYGYEQVLMLMMGRLQRTGGAILVTARLTTRIADVAMRMVKYKHLPLVSGSMAYNLALVDTFLRPLGQKLRIVMDTVDGPVEREGQYMFALAANGQYYGGGYHGSPLSQADDGLLDFVLIEKVSHLKMLAVLGKYKRGEHLDLPICETFRGTSMTVYADTPAVVTADGECFATPEVTFTLKPASLSFVYPASTEMLNNYEICEKSVLTP